MNSVFSRSISFHDKNNPIEAAFAALRFSQMNIFLVLKPGNTIFLVNDQIDLGNTTFYIWLPVL